MRLQVNIAHCATLREARGGSFPDPVWAASMAELAGASGVIAHMREDGAHLQGRDAKLLRQSVRGTFVMAMAPVDGMIAQACEVRPDVVVLLAPLLAEEPTHGAIDLKMPALEKTIERLRGVGCRVAVRIGPDSALVRQAADLGAEAVELSTVDYGPSRGAERDVHLQRLASAAVAAAGAGMSVAVGGALDYQNIRPVAAIPGIEDFNVGHAVLAQALFVGIERAVRDMIALIG